MTFDEWWKSDGIQNPTVYETAAARKAWDAAVEECAKIVRKKESEVIEKNTYRGRVNSAAAFASGILEDIVTDILNRK